MKIITDPTNIIAKVQNMNLREVKKCEKACLKSLKKAKDDVCVLKDKNGEFQFPIGVMLKIINSLDERFNDLKGNGDCVIKKTEKDNIQPIANESKKSYINDTTKTLNNGDKTMNSTTQTTTKTTKTTTLNKGEKTMNKIAKIAPIAVKKILATQIVNKTDTKKTYWGGWGKVRAGMNAAFHDYEDFEILENEWLVLRGKLGGKNSPAFHYCWKLINKNRVNVKQEPNSTLRFIKNVKIRIAVAKDILANSDKYKNEIAENWEKTFGTEI